MDRRPYVVSPEADADMDAISDSIAERSVDVAIDFYTACREHFELIADLPGIGTARSTHDPLLRGLRSVPMKRFSSHVIFFLPREDDVLIVRILHGARDLGFIVKDA
ncbi:MAG: type II toxin-antitoxin system RelE/ParE family toxin [Phycisphaerae bacterium]